MNNLQKVLSIGLILSLNACNTVNPFERQFDANSQGMGLEAEQFNTGSEFYHFKDMPIPEKNTLIPERTHILGTSQRWVGKVAMTVPYTVEDVANFYLGAMPKFGWTEISSMRGPETTLIYSFRRRLAIVHIMRTGIETEVTFTVSTAGSSKKTAETGGTQVKKDMEQERKRDREDRGEGSNRNSQPQQMSTDVMNASAQQQAYMYQQAVMAQNFQAQQSQVALQTSVPTQGQVAAQGAALQPSVPTQAQAAQQSAQTQLLAADVNKALQGSLGLGDASNAYYPSTSVGVGVPPTQY